MKPSRRTTSRATTSRHARRGAHENMAAPAADSPQYAFARSEHHQFGAIAKFYTPLSLKSGAGRQYWDEVLRLLVNIRSECDAAAERLGYASAKDDGLAAVEYIGNKILEAVRGERRQQQIASVQKPSATKPPQPPKPSFTLDETKGEPEPRMERAGHPERAKLIDEFKQMLREQKTRLGVVINPQLAHEIAKQITILNEGMLGSETTESIKQMRQTIGPLLAKLSEKPKTLKTRSKPAKVPAASVAQKRKRPKTSRPKKTSKKVRSR
jgi:hypothetical protein